MKPNWVLAANAAHAKLFTSEKNELRLIREFFHDASMLRNQDLTNDQDGAATSHFGNAQHGMEKKTLPKLKEKEAFVVELVDCLKKGDQEHSFQSLYLIAPPQILGLLREKIGASLSKKIKQEIHKDLVTLDFKALRDYLPPAL